MHTNKQLVNTPYAKVLLGSAGRVKMYTHQSPNEKNKGVLIKMLDWNLCKFIKKKAIKKN